MFVSVRGHALYMQPASGQCMLQHSICLVMLCFHCLSATCHQPCVLVQESGRQAVCCSNKSRFRQRTTFVCRVSLGGRSLTQAVFLPRKLLPVVRYVHEQHESLFINVNCAKECNPGKRRHAICRGVYRFSTLSVS